MTPFQRAQGYILMEVMLAMFIFASMATYALYSQNMENKATEGRLLGQQYVAVNQAVGNYMVTHYAALEKLPVGCSQTAFAVGTPPALDTSLDCSLIITNTVSINNGMQPTVTELIAAGFLKKARVSGGTSVGVPSIPMEMTVKETNPSTGAVATAVGRLFINIDRVCLATHTATPGANSLPQAPGANGCPALTTTSLTSLVFNTQPYTMSTQASFGYANRMGAVWTEIGADVAMSNMSTGGELKGANFEVNNPVRKTAGNVGLPGIVAVRNGYGAAYANNHSRVDGSNPPTADWSFANNSITDVNKLTSQSVDTQTVMAKLVDSDALKLGDRVEGDACDVNKENVSFGNGSILVCKSSKWTTFGTKGLVNGLDYYEITVSKNAWDTTSNYSYYCTKGPCNESVELFYTTVIGAWFIPYQIFKSLKTSFKKDEWMPVLMRFQDQAFNSDTAGLLTGAYLMQSDYGFQVDGYGKYWFNMDSGMVTFPAAMQIHIVIRFYRITQ